MKVSRLMIAKVNEISFADSAMKTFEYSICKKEKIFPYSYQ